jgi:hypothetical protein
MLSHSLLLQCSSIFSIAAMLSHFSIGKVLNHSSLRQCSVIPRYYNVSHFPLLQCSAIPRATVLIHSSLLQCSFIFHCKRCSAIPRYYRARPFISATVLSHFSFLQRAGMLSHLAKWLSESARLGVGSVESASARSWWLAGAWGCVGPSHASGGSQDWGARLAQSV